MKRLAVLFSAVLVGFAPGVAHGATALLMGGVGPFSQLDDTQMATALGGHFAAYDQRVSVRFPGWSSLPAAIETGADNMISAIAATNGAKTIGGVSKSAPVIDEVLRRLMEDPNRPSREQLDAVIYGYPNPTELARSGVEYRPLPETPYDILLVKAQYDGVADWPDNPLNFLAVVNALMGMGQLHVEAAFHDIDDIPRVAPYYTRTTNSLGGTTTSILIPTRILPLLRPLAPNGVETDFVRFLDSVLRPVIDRAYDRPTVPASTLQRRATAPEPSPEPAEIATSRAKRQELRETSIAESRAVTRGGDDDVDDDGADDDVDDAEDAARPSSERRGERASDRRSDKADKERRTATSRTATRAPRG